MTRPRAEQICPEETLFYHCMCRCVRRAFLFGRDPYTDKDYSYRKGWILERLKLLSEVFTIDLCAYAVMSNHYHLVLRLSPDKAAQLTEHEVAARWTKLFSGDPLVKTLVSGGQLCDDQRTEALQTINLWRQRLADISWYMRSLNERIARRSNDDDGCTGRFWQGRFKSQAILDEAGLLASMAYVDLNPLRAGDVELPEDAVDISIESRLKALQEPPAQAEESGAHPAAKPKDQEQPDDKEKPKKKVMPPLLPFADEPVKQSTPCCLSDRLPCTLGEYLELIDWLGRAEREGKKSLSADAPPILRRLNIEAKSLVDAMSPGELSRGSTIGQPAKREAFARRVNRIRLFGPHLGSCA